MFAGAIHASGSRSARSSCARIAAPAFVVLQPRGGDRLAPQRVHQVRVEAVVFQQIGQPAPAERGLERHRRPHQIGGSLGTLSLTFFITQRDGVYRRSLMQADSLGVSGLAVAAGRGACHVASERPAAAGSRLASGLQGWR
jgi:hypothetical protein